MNFHIITLGCKINQYESQAISESLQDIGHVHVASSCHAGTIIINSCAVTARAVRDLKKICRQTCRLNPNAKIIITGCAAQIFENEISRLDQVHMVVPQNNKRTLLNGLDHSLAENKDMPEYRISDYSRARPVVKVQDGCTHRCTFCIVPLTRGDSISRPPQVIIDEIIRLLSKGFREIVLGGINLRLYGRDFSPEMDFWDLVQLLHQNIHLSIFSDFRLRLSSLEPSELNSKAIDTLASCQKICPHLHISLQSGSRTVLEKMNRGHYNPLHLSDFINRLKYVWPRFALGADIMVGFPGETTKDFQLTESLVKTLPLTYAHVFPFSPRPGTPAARFSRQVKDIEKKNRSSTILTLIQNKKQIFLQQLITEKELSLIMETDTKGMSEYYVQCCLTRPAKVPVGHKIRVRPLEIQGNKLIAEALSQ